MPTGRLNLAVPMATRRIKNIEGQALSAKDPGKENRNEGARLAIWV
jgi:hypothetical protein